MNSPSPRFSTAGSQDSSRGRRVLVVRRQGEQLQRRQAQQPLELLDQARLVDLLAHAGPVVQAADEDRLGRQVEQRAGAEGRDDLAVADLAVRPGVGSGHGYASSSSTSMLSSVFTHRLTPGSTSRMERFA